jgi:fibronectin-binding autotransporter adhesin
MGTSITMSLRPAQSAQSDCRFRSACLAIGVLVLAAAPAVAQSTWVGGQTPTPTTWIWSDPNNWVGGTVPAAGSTITFADPTASAASLAATSNDLTGLSLTGIAVNGSVAGPVNITGNGFSLGAGGISMTGATQNLSINTNLTLSSSQNWGTIAGRTLTIGAIPGGNTVALSATTANTLTLAWTGVGTIVLNSNITDGAAPSGVSTSAGAASATVIQFRGNNTYTGPTTIAARGEVIQIGSDSPFGNGGTVTFPNVPTNTAPRLEAIDGPHSFNNPVTLNFGFNLGGSNNLTFNGNITLDQGRTLATTMATGTSATFNGNVTISGGTTVLSLGPVSSPTTVAAMVFNGNIAGPAGQGVTLIANGNGSTAFGLVEMNGQNTYSGTTTLAGQRSTIQVGSSSVTDISGTILSGPLGTGTLNPTNTNTRARLAAINGPQTVANPITLTANLEVEGLPTLGQTNVVVSDLTLTGLISGGGQLFKSGPTTLTLQGANTYTGATTVSGGRLLVSNTTGSATGNGAVIANGTSTAGSGGTIGGGNSAGTVGFISGGVTISTATIGATSGGILSPGTSVGTLTVTGGASNWNQLGTYVFEHNASATGVAPVGGTSDLFKGTGTATLSLATLTSANPFNLVLTPTNGPASPPTAAVTYTLADFSAVGINSITPPTASTPNPDGSVDLTPFFNPNAPGSSYQSALGFSALLDVNHSVISVTFTPVPEPAFVLAACGALASVVGWRRHRAARPA